jgi:glycosyltransferase involved in cell wall biosynthesis
LYINLFTKFCSNALIARSPCPVNFPDGIEFLLADGERARTIGLNARKIIEEHFSAEVVARRAIEAIDRVWLEKYGK